MKVLAWALVLVMVAGAILVTVPSATASSESGTFPDRVFTVTKSAGSLGQGETFRARMTPASGGGYTVYLDQLAGSAVVVALYRIDGNTAVLMAQAKLRTTVEVFGPQQLLAGRTYEVSLTPQGKPGTSILHEWYYSTAPSACFTYGSAEPFVGAAVTFDASCTVDPDNNIVGYAWDFGDGGTGTGSSVSHAFVTDGSFTVSLYVTDALGDRGTYEQVVRVRSPSAGFRTPFVDYGVDWDSDGFYDALRVDLNIYSPAIANYTLEGTLYAYYSHTSSEFLGLGTGVYSVGIEFDGVSLRLDGVDGPYAINFYLYAEGGAFVASASYTTGPYRSTDFQPVPVRLSPPHSDSGVDTNGDGLYEYLALDVNLSITRPTHIMVFAMLHDSDLTFSINATAEAYLTVGAATVRVLFKGLRINQVGVDGPYEVWISATADWQGSWIQVDRGNHTTNAYLASDFETPGARFVPPFSDAAYQVDADASYDFLAVVTPVLFDWTMGFTVRGTLLQESTQSYVAWAASSSTAGPGLVNVGLRFNGIDIRRSGLDGPYLVILDLVDVDATVLDRATYVTSTYLASDFDLPAAVFSPPHTDYGLDTDGDGLYNQLVVEVSIIDTDPTMVDLVASLSPDVGGGYADNRSVLLSPGPQTLILRFDGLELSLTGYDGSYQVYLTLYDDWSFSTLDSATYTTHDYRHTQFEESPAKVVPGSSVLGVDADANGLYESLVGYLVVDVVNAGWFHLVMNVYTLDYSRSAAVVTDRWLDVGVQTVDLSLSGSSVRAFGVDGPYPVTLRISTGLHDLQLGWVNLVTPAYGFLAFE